MISTFSIDSDLDMADNYDHYHPNVKKLNQTINDWASQEINFYGMFHTHFPGGVQLSLRDEKYITQIMLAMPPNVNKLFFPIILETKIIGYQASRHGLKVHICRDDIKIIKSEDLL